MHRFSLLFHFICALITICSAIEMQSFSLHKNEEKMPTANTEFIFAFMNSHLTASDHSYTENLTLSINNANPKQIASVLIESNYINFTTIKTTVNPMQTIQISIQPVSIQTNYLDKHVNEILTENKGLRVTSNVSVSVLASNEHDDGTSGDSFTLLPVCQLGSSYEVIGDESPFATSSLFTVIAIQDNTVVTFQNGSRHNHTRTLNRLQTLTYTVNTVYLTNIEVESSAPIAVISGTVCGVGWQQSGGCDYMAAMLLPASVWGTEFPMVPFAGKPYAEYTLTANEDNTAISIDGTLRVVMNTSHWLRIYWDSGYLTATKPVQIMQVGGRTDLGGDPFFVHVPPVRRFLSTPVQFNTGPHNAYDETTHFVRVSVSLRHLGLVTLDGYTPSALLYTRVGRSSFYFYETRVAVGTHSLAPVHDRVQYSGVVYGYGFAQMAYGFVVGMDMPCVAPAAIARQ